MLIEASKLKKEDENRITCGRCHSEYSPRVSVVVSAEGDSEESTTDCSCPVCGHGKFRESFEGKPGKMILND